MGDASNGGRRATRLLKRGGLFMLAACTTGFIAVVLGIWTPTIIPAPASLAEKLDTIGQEAAERNSHTLIVRRPHLRGSGTRSFFFVFRDNRLTELRGPPSRWRSDEIRIYDLRDDDLEERLRFRPQEADGGPYLFNLEAADDLDDNGVAEVVGSFSQFGMTPHTPQPLAVTWSEKQQQYMLRSLIVDPPRLLRSKDSTPYQEAESQRY